MVVEKKKLMTAEELFELPGEQRYELINGEPIEMVPGAPLQGQITMRLGSPLHVHVQQHGLGVVITNEPGFILRRNPDLMRAPDIAFIAKERVPASGVPERYWELAPDLVVEVISPPDRAADVQLKVEEWLQAGVRAVWVVYPATRSIAVHTRDQVRMLREGDALEGGAVVPGFACPVGSIF